ncbi:S49 family peptidase [Arenibacterium halophilum]|uniref:S49 family peptidase n=1 Tax=Arenibacterium halophilum TaxID=2583821 RepID=A0ABY2WWZ8_9RHOB|nr:S49 family peptidase [Arenibacterium halophilum]TMV07310.1 S49 family peptidase [Arenibacterium halophilum]
MPHEIERVLRAVSASTWLIEENKGAEIAAFLALRAGGPTEGWQGEAHQPVYAMEPVPARGGGAVHHLRLQGTIMPRGSGMMSRMSGGASLDQFQRAFRSAAEDTSARAIVLEVDSPGGLVDMVPETATLVRAARRLDRPIIAVANTLAASAAYWIASSADEIVVTPSGLVGSIGVMTQRDNMQKALAQAGIQREMFAKGPRKLEGHPYGPPIDDAARAAIEEEAEALYAMFTSDVAKSRGVPVSVVRADPEKSERHFGGGRTYRAKRAVALGMADRIATLEDTLMRAARGRPARRASLAARRLAML